MVDHPSKSEVMSPNTLQAGNNKILGKNMHLELNKLAS